MNFSVFTEKWLH